MAESTPPATSIKDEETLLDEEVEEEEEEEDDDDDDEHDAEDLENLDDEDDLDDEEEEAEEESLPPASWEEQFERLRAFQRLTGHCRVPRVFAGDRAKLGPFVHQQRMEYRKLILRQHDDETGSLLTPERIDRLNSIGFDWMIKTEKRTTVPAVAAAGTLVPPEVAAAAALAAEEDEEKAAAWQEQFELLRSFYNENGHTRVPKNMVGDTKGLGLWVYMLRKQAKKLLFGEETALTLEQIGQLNTLRFEWNLKTAPPVSNETSWQQKYELLQDFRRAHGHCRVPPSYVVGSTRLGNWVASQRRFYKMNAGGTVKIAQDRIDKLDAIGFEWSLTKKCNIRSPSAASEASWQKKFALLQAFHREYGHCRVPQHYEVDGVKLGLWVPSQRVAYKNKMDGKGGYPQERVDMLNSIGFEWKVKVRNSIADSWTQNYDLLCAFQREKGHCRVPKRFEFGSVKLGLWVREQRRYFKHLRDGTNGPAALTSERIAQLNEIGFVWSCKDKEPISPQDECFAIVEERLKKRALESANKRTTAKKPRTKIEYGTEQISTPSATELRIGQHATKPTPSRSQILLASNDSVMSVEAQAGKNSSSLSPKQPEAAEARIHHPSTAAKTENLPESDKKEASTEEPRPGANVEIMNSVNPARSAQKRDNAWDFKFSLLRAFQIQHGHCHVPPNYVVDSIQLGSWAKAQRKLKRENIEGKSSVVAQNRIEQLDSIGFDWITPVRGEKPELWNEKFELLSAFHREHGHCRVPKRFMVGSVKLGLWVREMRRYYRNLKEGRNGPAALSSQRITQLNSIGFVWSCKGESPWDLKFSLLQSFQREHGNCLVPDGLVMNGEKLGRFVANQRKYYKSFLAGHKVASMTQDRIDKLNSIGFDWQTASDQRMDAAIAQHSKEDDEGDDDDDDDDDDDNEDDEIEEADNGSGSDRACGKGEESPSKTDSAGQSREREKGKAGDGRVSGGCEPEGGELPTNPDAADNKTGMVREEDACGKDTGEALPPEDPPMNFNTAGRKKRRKEDEQDGTTDRLTAGDRETRNRKFSMPRSSPRRRTLPRFRGK